MGFIFIQKQPSILISSTFDLVLLNGDGEQIKVNNLRREKFIRETIILNNPKLKVLEDINLYTPEQIKKAAQLKKNEKKN